jgi:hypothetical protein
MASSALQSCYPGSLLKSPPKVVRTKESSAAHINASSLRPILNMLSLINAQTSIVEYLSLKLDMRRV